MPLIEVVDARTLAGRCLPWSRRTSWVVRAYVRTLRESTGSSCRCTATWSTRGRSDCACCSTCTPTCGARRAPAATPSTAPGDDSCRPPPAAPRRAAVRGLARRRSPSTAVSCRPSRRTTCPRPYRVVVLKRGFVCSLLLAMRCNYCAIIARFASRWTVCAIIVARKLLRAACNKLHAKPRH